MKILLYGSPFDPIHHGHLNIVKQVKEKLGFEKVIFILTKNPRWKDTLTPVQHRLAMLKLATLDMPYVELCLFEMDSEAAVNFTIDTMRHLKKQYPNDELSYLIGSDQVVQLHKWKNIDEMTAMVRWITYQRGTTPIRSENVKRYRVERCDGPLYNISSTAVRELQSLDTPLVVIHYILDHDLYFTPRLRSYYSRKRFEHVVSVADVAYQIAKSNGLNPHQAFLAALIHDIAKDFDKEEQRRIVEENFPVDERPEFSLHQYVGAIIAKKEFSIEDPLVLDAVACHATGRANMTWLDKVLYASDKIEPLRGYDSSKSIELCQKNFEEGFRQVLKENVAFQLLKKQKPVGKDMRECIAQYLGGNTLDQ